MGGDAVVAESNGVELPAPRGVVRAVAAAVDAALGAEWDEVDGLQLLADVEALMVVSDRMDALRMTSAGALDRSGVWAELGSRSASALLAKRAPHRCRRRGRADVRLGTRLRRLPHARTAFEAGEITVEHVKVLGECLHRRFMGRLVEFEEQLVALAGELAWEDWLRLVRLWQDNADATDPNRADEADLAAREVFLSPGFGGRGVLAGTLTPYAAQVVGAEMERLAGQLFRDDWAAAADGADGGVHIDDLGRSASQRRHDALLLMAERSASLAEEGDPGAPPAGVMVYVHCTEAELEASMLQTTGLPPEPADLGGVREYEDGTPVSRRMLARLAVRAAVKRVVFGPQGQLVDLGATGRLFSRSQREAIVVRDRRCVCGCGLSARLCEMDHIIEFRDGGLTVIANGQPMCRSSHRHKTRIRNRGPDGGA